jgi:murein DD-endopeptidase MepM/ murein hydrolase activator NlpD
MKWLLTFLAGVVVGVAGLFVYQQPVSGETSAAASARAAAENGSLPPPAGGLGAPRDPSIKPVDPQANAGAAVPDLSDLDLPLRPGTAAASAGSGAPAAPAVPDGKLLVPVDAMPFARLSDTFDQPRGTERHHEALDIMAPKGTKVIAAADGKVAKLFTSKPGGLTVYQFDPSEKYAYYYAHLDKYADGLQEGAQIKRGDVIGYVGVTGNSDPNAPHLHFAVFELTPEKQWWKGTPINPYPLMKP